MHSNLNPADQNSLKDLVNITYVNSRIALMLSHVFARIKRSIDPFSLYLRVSQLL